MVLFLAKRENASEYQLGLSQIDTCEVSSIFQSPTRQNFASLVMRHTYHSVMHSGPIYASMSLFLCMISPERVVLRHQVKARGQSSERKHPRLYKPQHYCITIPSSHSSFLFTLNLLDCIYMLISIYWISLSFVSGMLQWQQWCWGLQVCYGSIRR